MFRNTDIWPARLSAFRRGFAILLAGILLVTFGCAQRVSMPSSNLNDVAYLSASEPLLRKLCLLCPRFQTELFAVDQKRVLDRKEVVLEPGQHEVEFAIYWFGIFNIGVRMLSFDAAAGKSYQLGVQDISGNPFGGFHEQYPGYWIKERETDKIVADGKGGKGEEGGFDRKWYIDQFHGRIDSIPSNDGEATVIVTTVEPLWVTIAGAEEHPVEPRYKHEKWIQAQPSSKTPSAKEGYQGGYSVPAGKVVIEVFNRRKYVRYYGRLVVDLRPGKTYHIEAEGTGFSHTDISEVWIADATTKEKVGQFHSCWTSGGGTSFSDCEETSTAEIEYADIKPGDPRFWWGPSGQDF